MDMENTQMDMENGDFGRFWTLWGLFGDSETPCPTRDWTIWTVFTKKSFYFVNLLFANFF